MTEYFGHPHSKLRMMSYTKHSAGCISTLLHLILGSEAKPRIKSNVVGPSFTLAWSDFSTHIARLFHFRMLSNATSLNGKRSLAV